MKKEYSDRVELQLKLFRDGIPNCQLGSEAELGSGIRELTEIEEQTFKEEFENTKQSVEKFVPASGAATRMGSRTSSTAS